MTDLWAVAMLVSGGLFAGGVTLMAWERLPAWREADLPEFRATFAHTLRRVDRVQPALAVICLITTVGYSLSVADDARVLAAAAAMGFLAVLVSSGAWLVPIQRRVVSAQSETSSDVLSLRATWIRGHLIRTTIALVAFALAVVAATL
jgi:hypothetical protein